MPPCTKYVSNFWCRAAGARPSSIGHRLAGIAPCHQERHLGDGLSSSARKLSNIRAEDMGDSPRARPLSVVQVTPSWPSSGRSSATAGLRHYFAKTGWRNVKRVYRLWQLEALQIRKKPRRFTELQKWAVLDLNPPTYQACKAKSYRTTFSRWCDFRCSRKPS